MFLLLLIFVTFVKCDNFTVNDCQNHWFNYENQKCIQLLTETKVNYNEANHKCNELNASLLSIGSERENIFLASLLYGLDTKVKGLYIGLRRKVVNESLTHEFEWTDGWTLGYENWAKNEPSPPTWGEPCAEIFSADNHNTGKWNDLSCGSQRFAICQQLIRNDSNEYREEVELCERLDYVRYANNCYKAYDHWQALDWPQADLKCKSDHINGSLLYIESSYEHSFIKYWTQSQLKSYEFWIGLYAKNNSLNLQYEWINQWPVFYTAWDKSEPKYRAEADIQCVIQNRDTGLWRNNPYCSDKRAFICKISDQSLPGDDRYVSGVCPQFVNSTTGATTDHWINLHKQSKHCFWFSETLTMDWRLASKHCRKRNGTLVSIHSAHESQLLKPFVQKDERQIWIGLSQSPSGHYRWEDGSEVDFENWFTGEPTDETNEMCVEMRAQDLHWNDIHCSKYNLQFVCEINKIVGHLNATNVTGSGVLATHTDASNGVVLVIIFVLIPALGMCLGMYYWLTKYTPNVNNYCICCEYLKRKSVESTGANSNRSSINERNAFDINY